MKKFLTLFMILGLVACGNKEPKTETNAPVTPPPTTQTTPVTTNTTATATPTNVATATAPYTEDYLKTHDDIRAKVIEDCKANKQTQENCTIAHSIETKKKMFKKY